MKWREWNWGSYIPWKQHMQNVLSDFDGMTSFIGLATLISSLRNFCLMWNFTQWVTDQSLTANM
jgi:hypothetical protein